MTAPLLLPGEQIKQGESLRVALGLKDVISLTGWKCRVVVSASATGADPILGPTNVTTKNSEGSRFVHFVPRDTTRDWPVGDYFYMADVYNESTGEGKELHGELRVDLQGVV